MSTHVSVHNSRFADKRRVEASFDKADHSATAWYRIESTAWEGGESAGTDHYTLFVDGMTVEEVDAMIESQRRALREVKKWNSERAGIQV